MESTKITAIYLCQDDIFWIKDRDQTILIAETRQRCFFLRELEAAIWSWLITGCQIHQLCQRVSLFLDITEAEAWTRILKVMDDWVLKGILKKEED